MERGGAPASSSIPQPPVKKYSCCYKECVNLKFWYMLSSYLVGSLNLLSVHTTTEHYYFVKITGWSDMSSSFHVNCFCSMLFLKFITFGQLYLLVAYPFELMICKSFSYNKDINFCHFCYNLSLTFVLLTDISAIWKSFFNYLIVFKYICCFPLGFLPWELYLEIHLHSKITKLFIWIYPH